MELEDPLCFKGVQLRGGMKYRDLRKYSFSFIEICWLCEAIRNVDSNGFKKVVNRYNIYKAPVKRWLREFRLGTLTDMELGITVAEIRAYQAITNTT
jgi:hypothetical protein